MIKYPDGLLNDISLCTRLTEEIDTKQTVPTDSARSVAEDESDCWVTKNIRLIADGNLDMNIRNDKDFRDDDLSSPLHIRL